MLAPFLSSQANIYRPMEMPNQTLTSKIGQVKLLATCFLST